ncbi:hypothetical protein SLS56_005076 [Neofusicoccum ribis]|uniref:Transmembrane protein n=1 Tax=Neofusicoccum ribis TaxID=45134 RepID=A0ABR3SUM8_9PEZI
MPWTFEDEIRRAQAEDAHAAWWEEYTESVNDAWDDLTTLPIVITIMGNPVRLDSTGMPPWLTAATEPPDALQSTDDDGQLTAAPSAAPTTGPIPMTASTTVPLVSNEAAATGAVPSASNPTASSSWMTGSGTNTPSPSSTLCTTTSGVDVDSNGAAEPSTATGAGFGNNGGVTIPSGSPSNDGPGGPPLALIVAAVIIPIVVVAVLAFAAFLVFRRRKQRRDAERASASEEMKLRLSDDFSPSGPGSDRGQEPPPPQAPPRVVTPTATTATPPPPVIISAMNPANNSAYFTGIDTSEALSVRTNSVRSGQRTAGFMMDGEFHEEPPPPYRPRSVPPISRDSSMRTNNRADCASTHLMSNEPRSVNPFADPSDDDDDMSIISGGPMEPYSRRTDDHLSVVSDMSYQNEPTPVHQAV